MSNVNFCASLSIGIFLSSLDLAIVATALVPIANSLHSFDRGSWFMNAYLLTYIGERYPLYLLVPHQLEYQSDDSIIRFYGYFGEAQ